MRESSWANRLAPCGQRNPPETPVCEFCGFDGSLRTSVIWWHIRVSPQGKDPLFLLDQALLQPTLLFVGQSETKQPIHCLLILPDDGFSKFGGSPILPDLLSSSLTFASYVLYEVHPDGSFRINGVLQMAHQRRLTELMSTRRRLVVSTPTLLTDHPCRRFGQLLFDHAHPRAAGHSPRRRPEAIATPLASTCFLLPRCLCASDPLQGASMTRWLLRSMLPLAELCMHASLLATVPSDTEPTIFFEYAQDIARLAHQAGLIVVAKSNGYMAPDVLQEMASWLDAINIDLKGWRSETHRRVVGGELEPGLKNLRMATRLGLWLEVTTLIVPGLSDDSDDLENIARFIANELGQGTPWHLPVSSS